MFLYICKINDVEASLLVKDQPGLQGRENWWLKKPDKLTAKPNNINQVKSLGL